MEACTEEKWQRQKEMSPNWREIYANTAHTPDRDDELIPVTRETLRLAKNALRKMNEDDYYHNNGAAEQEIAKALKQEIDP